MGIGIPKSQSKMYPVAPTCLIRFIKRISVSFLNVIDLNVRVRTNGPVIAKIDDRGMDDYVMRQKLRVTHLLFHLWLVVRSGSINL